MDHHQTEPKLIPACNWILSGRLRPTCYATVGFVRFNKFNKLFDNTLFVQQAAIIDSVCPQKMPFLVFLYRTMFKWHTKMGQDNIIHLYLLLKLKH